MHSYLINTNQKPSSSKNQKFPILSDIIKARSNPDEKLLLEYAESSDSAVSRIRLVSPLTELLKESAEMINEFILFSKHEAYVRLKIISIYFPLVKLNFNIYISKNKKSDSRSEPVKKISNLFINVRTEYFHRCEYLQKLDRL